MPTFPLPVHRVVAYYQSSTSGKKYFSPTPLISLATHLIMAAFHLGEDSNKNLTIYSNSISPNDSSLIRLWTDIARMQGSGIKVMAMLGGAGTGSYQKLAENFDGYYAPLAKLIKDRRLDGIDLDIEETAYYKKDEKTQAITTYDVAVMLITKLRAGFGEEFIITMTPVASALKGGVDSFSGFNYSTLEKKQGTSIDWYNVQFYSGFGSMASANDYEDIVKNCPLDPSRIVAIILANKGDGSGFVELDKVKSTMRKLLKKYGNRFGGIASWEYFNSNPDTDEPWTWAAVMQATMVNYKEVLAMEYMNST